LLTAERWIIALAEREPDLQSQGLPTLLNALGRQIDMKAVHEALATRAPAKWFGIKLGSIQKRQSAVFI